MFALRSSRARFGRVFKNCPLIAKSSVIGVTRWAGELGRERRQCLARTRLERNRSVSERTDGRVWKKLSGSREAEKVTSGVLRVLSRVSAVGCRNRSGGERDVMPQKILVSCSPRGLHRHAESQKFFPVEKMGAPPLEREGDSIEGVEFLSQRGDDGVAA